MTKTIELMNQIIWGAPALVLIISVGVLVSIRTGFVQFRLLPAALRSLFSSFKKSDAEKSQYKALCTALAATVGTGNIVGVAGAIAIGGPGSVFWMWVCALLGMATKYAEALLSVRYQKIDIDGNRIGGPMHVAAQTMGKSGRSLSLIYSFFGIVATLGVGASTQINSMLGGINCAVVTLGGQRSPVMNVTIGVTVSIIAVCSLAGGFKKVGDVSSFLVPFASLLYILLCFGILIYRKDVIGNAFYLILKNAFDFSSISGGIFGSFFQTVRVGASRGVFTNEAGMGTAGIAHSSANVKHPVEQGMMGILEVFLDTIVICTMTALAILCSGYSIPYGSDLGIQIAIDSFVFVYGQWISIPMAFALSCFAVATVLGWGYYGIRFAQYLFGSNVCKGFVYLQGAAIMLGSILNTGTVWALSELANGCMAIPNLIILFYLNPEITNLTNDFYIKRRFSTIGGTNENFNQCESV